MIQTTMWRWSDKMTNIGIDAAIFLFFVAIVVNQSAAYKNWLFETFHPEEYRMQAEMYEKSLLAEVVREEAALNKRILVDHVREAAVRTLCLWIQFYPMFGSLKQEGE